MQKTDHLWFILVASLPSLSKLPIVITAGSKNLQSNHKDKPAFIIRDIVYLATPGEEKSMSFASSDLDNVVARESVHKGGNEPSWLPLL